jgi:hypothetical protein
MNALSAAKANSYKINEGFEGNKKLKQSDKSSNLTPIRFSIDLKLLDQNQPVKKVIKCISDN